MNTNRCQDFLIRHRLRSEQYDAGEILDAFLDEMGRGLVGESSSLAMIPSYIPLPELAPRDQAVIAVDAGGTNFRTALIRFDGGSQPHVEYHTTHTMPGADGELTMEEFFNRIADYLQPVLGRSDRLAFCFSYPARIDPRRDGTLLYWTKEIQAPQVVGQRILANLETTLRRRGLPCPARSLVLNDTVAALLAGCTATGFAPGTGYAGFILGTGTNTAYIERNPAIRKEPGLPADGGMAINCEAANFNQIRRSDIDLAFDADTAHPGKYVLEKMISGAYLGGLCHRVLRAAAAEGVLGGVAARDLETGRPYETTQIGGLLTGLAEEQAGAAVDPHSHWPDPDRAVARDIVSAVVERAALITAVNMAAPIVKPVREGCRPDRFCISADGSVYFKLPTFRERAERHLAAILGPLTIDYRIVHVEEATLIGTAVAGLI